MNYLQAYEDVDTWDMKNTEGKNNNDADDDNDEDDGEPPMEVEYVQNNNKKVTSSRERLRLFEKKHHVDEYYAFANLNIALGATTESLMRAFIAQHNANSQRTRTLSKSNLFKWIKAEKRGEYSDLGGINNLNASICKVTNLLNHIDKVLRTRDRAHAAFNKLAKSPSLPTEYGVIARKYTPAGTFLGYYKGEVIDGLEASKRFQGQEYIFTLSKDKFIDATRFDSCYGRYYNCAFKAVAQNVSVERIDTKNPQKVICFIANKDIEKGEEFLISYGSAYWERVANRAPLNSPFRRVCNAMIRDNPEFETAEALYSVEAPTLAQQFQDDRSDEENGGNDDDSDSEYSGN